MRKVLIASLSLLLMVGIAFAAVDTFEGQTATDTWEGVSTTDTREGQSVAAGGYSCDDDAFTPSGTGGQERFECGANSYDDSTVLEQSTWVHSNTAINNAYATGCPQGEKCLAMTGSYTADVTIPGTDGDQYIAFAIKNADANGDRAGSINRVVDLRGDGDLLATINIEYEIDGSVSTMTVSDAGMLTLFEEYITDADTNLKYIKILYNNGSGTNAAVSAWYSGDGSNWTAFDYNGTNDNTSTAQMDTIRLRKNQDDLILFDDVRWDTADINY